MTTPPDTESVEISAGSHAFRWNDWSPLLPVPERGKDNGRTHGVCVSPRSGRVVVLRQAAPAVLVFEPDGTLIDVWGDRFLGAHGLSLGQDGDCEALWLTDQESGEVVKTTLEGETLLQLEAPSLAAYEEGTYAPTWVASFDAYHGGNGDVWVADGYGMNYVHRYDRTGRYLGSINGEEGNGGAFDCPHGIWVDTRRAAPEFYIADRGNRQLQVYDPDGMFKRAVGNDALGCPCAGVVHGGELYVPELCARITILDADDRLVGYLGRNEAACDLAGWPDLPDEQLRPGAFNSPHGLAADADGSLYVVEWIVGGRVTKLERC